MVGKDVNFYVKKSNQVDASGSFKHDHAIKLAEKGNHDRKSRENRSFEKTVMWMKKSCDKNSQSQEKSCSWSPKVEVSHELGLAFFHWGWEAPPSETFALLKFGPKTIEKISITTQICITIDFAPPPEKNSWKKAWGFYRKKILYVGPGNWEKFLPNWSTKNRANNFYMVMNLKTVPDAISTRYLEVQSPLLQNNLPYKIFLSLKGITISYRSSEGKLELNQATIIVDEPNFHPASPSQS